MVDTPELGRSGRLFVTRSAVRDRGSRRGSARAGEVTSHDNEASNALAVV
jgi:hypothetical protein